MTKNAAILFYLKKRANSNEEKVPVYVRITCDDQRVELATGQKNSAQDLESRRGKSKGKTEAVLKLNSALNDLQLKINGTIRYLKDCGEALTAEKSKIDSWEKLKGRLCKLMYSKNITVKRRRSISPITISSSK